MLKNISKLEHVIGERVFNLLADSDSPLNEVKEALFYFIKFVGKIEDQVKEQQTQAQEEPKIEEIPQG